MLERPRKANIHIFSINDRKMILSVNSLLLFEVRKLAEDILSCCDGKPKDAVIAELKSRYNEGDILTALKELEQMGALVEADRSKPHYSPPKTSYLTALAFHVCHDCNLACRYCYGDGGTYGGEKSYMNNEVAEATIDFLFNNSEQSEEISITFFGGEPLLNFQLIKHIVQYSRQKAEVVGKKVRFNMTTNGTLFSNEVIDYVNNEKLRVMVSIDGYKEIQDYMRPCLNGSSSYDLMLPGMEKFIQSREGNVSARASYTPKDLNLLKITEHLFELGFRRVYLSPVSTSDQGRFSLKRDRISVIKSELERIAKDLLNRVKRKDYRGLSLFDRFLEQIHYRRKKIYPCGGGRTYFGVSPEGDIHLCHRFVGMEEFKLGNVLTGWDRSLQKEILTKHVDERKKCRRCWARYLCGGGCYYQAFVATGDIFNLDPIMCDLRKNSLELSMWLYTQIHDEDKEILRNLYESLSDPYRDGHLPEKGNEPKEQSASGAR